MQTSYALISIYKQRITALDRAIHHPPRQGAQQQHQQPPRAVEYRRLLQRFRQFLSEEEKFWTQLVLRFRRHFALDESQTALTTLGVVPESEPDSKIAASVLPTTPAQRDGRIAIMSKALVCLGDIARYKELYNEAGGRPRAGHEDGPPAAASTSRSGRGRRGGGPAQADFMALPRLRNYDRAQSCYEQARLLLPFDGNPSHQLAILSSYQKDVFGSLVHYYRALCVRTPYETAAENLSTVLNKAFEQYQAKGLIREQEKQAEAANGTHSVPRLRVEAFKEKVVVLHSMWGMNIDEAKELGEKVVEDFASLVADRILPIDMISKVVVLLQGALWKHRMLRRPSNGEKRSARLSATESQIVTHLIATHRVLLENGSIELTEAPPEDAVEHDLAQRITATFRRTLPALRMTGKWLRSNTRYISQTRKNSPTSQDDGSGVKEFGKGKEKRSNNTPPVVIGGIEKFWSEYSRFCDALINAFPVEQLPELKTQLEEDIELTGFLPLRKYMYGSDGKPPGSRVALTDAHGERDGSSDSHSSQERLVGRDQVHPNEEQLMRIADILLDAKAVADDENTPITFNGSSFLIEDLRASGGPPLTTLQDKQRHPTTNYSQPLVESRELPSYLPTPSELDDDNVSLTTRTDDDPVRDAFSRVIDGPDNDYGSDEELIVWQPSARLSPKQDPVFSVSPKSPMGKGNTLSPRRLDAEKSPPLVVPPTTAEDILNSITRSPGTSHHTRNSSLPPVSLPLLGNSIWSTSTNAGTPHYSRTTVALGNGLSYSPQTIPPSPQVSATVSHNTLASPSRWQSTLPAASALPNYSGGSALNGFITNQPLHGIHQRVASQPAIPSRSSTLSSLPPQRHSDLLDPSLYSHRQATLNDPGNPKGSDFFGRLPPIGYTGAYSPAPNVNSYYRQSQPDFYDVGAPAQQLRREQNLHSPFPTSTISNIWGSPG
ncbi:hypothetical protein BDY19DRAFT_950147 [Irpex rosettiformis]|uniref:Uncharacterized protein n=1 Tax=Irpex rosettiformis TaxID=378272 RepID=A0ACB8U1Y0_9APHY|nr:hypothetical protein BDY19DRAFT_950147 [Irpex rosettiformis]